MNGNNRIGTAIALLNALLAKSDAEDGEYIVYRSDVRLFSVTIANKRIVEISQDHSGEQAALIFRDEHAKPKIASGQDYAG